MNLKIGDKVGFKKNNFFSRGCCYEKCLKLQGKIIDFNLSDSILRCSVYIDSTGTTFYDIPADVLKLINNFNDMSLKEEFLISLKKEPEKSFRKAGIIDSNDLITEEGQEIFLTWLLQKNGDEFKKEIVDKIIKEEN